MTAKRALHIAVCSIAAGVLLAFGFLLDSHRTRFQQTLAGLQWARQVTSQAESLYLQAREAGQKDPMNWVVSQLAQGVEPRVIQVVRVQSENADPSKTETYALNSGAGSFTYNKVIVPEQSAGIEVSLNLGYLGFLGAKSKLAQDFLAMASFALLFGVLFFSTGKLFGFDDTQKIRELVQHWVGNAKGQLTQLSIHIREMVRQSQRLAVASGTSRALVGELRTKIHSGLNDLHDGKKFFQAAEAAAAKAEGLALRATLDANRMGASGVAIGEMVGEIHKSIGAMRTALRQSQALVHKLEKQVEPWSTDADVAYHAFDDVQDATQILSHHIRQTTETLLGQAKLIQRLNQTLAEDIEDGNEPEQVRPQAPALALDSLPEPLPQIGQEPEAEQVTQPFLKRIRFKKSA